jgi:hypothetical protein
MQENTSAEKSLEQKDEELSETVASNDEFQEQKTFPLKYVEKLRRECSKYRTALKEMKDIYEEFPPESVEEYKKLNESLRAKELESMEDMKLKKEGKVNDLITNLAMSYSAISPEQVATLLRNDIDIDDEGRAFLVSGRDISVKDFIKDFLSSNLHLVRSKSKRGANTSPSTSNMFSIEQISNMTAEQYERNRDRILKTISQKS